MAKKIDRSGFAPHSTSRLNLPYLRRRLLAWYAKNRRDYPWRNTSNWFHLLMAEMMLRRTRADQVVAVYEEFTRRYQTPAAAARLKKKALEKMLYPLGLHWRGAQLHETIHYLKDNYSHRAIAQSDDLLKIPGVGDYSNAMLRNRLYGEPRAALDANLVRLFQRWQGLPYCSEGRRDRQLIDLADRFLKSKHTRELNLALIDFSALVCRPRTPQCWECPLRKECATGARAV